MKTTPNLLKNASNLASALLIVFAFSCSPDTTALQDDLDKKNGKTNTADLKTLVRGANLKGANGVDIGADGNLYVASVNGLEIVVMNKNNGKIIKRFGPESGVLGPDDLVFGPDGSLYWTNILVGSVGKLAPDGTVKLQDVAPGVNPIAFSDDGSRLFVALDFLGDGLYELDPDLIDPPRPIILCPTGFCLGFFNSFDTREENGRLYLYGPLFAANLVIAIDVTDEGPPIFPTFPDVLGDPSIRIVAGLDGAFDNPAAVKFGPDGLLYVLDQAGEVWKVNPDGVDDKTLFTTLQPGLDNMVFDEDGSLYMTNNDEGWVAEVLKSGQARIISVGGMIRPSGLAVLPGSKNQDIIFEADLFSMRQFNGTSGQQLNSYKGYLIPEEDPVTLILPMNVSADGDNLIVSSWFSSGVQVWNPQDGVIENYPIGTALVPGTPIDAIRFKSRIIVTEANVGGLIWADDQSVIATLAAPSGLATDGEKVWVADWSTGEVYQLNYDGSDFEAPVPVASGLKNPEGLALDNEGNLVVVESGESRVSRIELPSGNVTTLAENLELSGPGLGLPPTWSFDGVAVGPSGDIYVSGAGVNVIYKIPQNKAR